jgi:transposase
MFHTINDAKRCALWRPRRQLHEPGSGVVAGRDTASALELWRRLPAAQRERIESVAIDMSPEFTAAARQFARRAVVVYDRIHVAKHLNEAVDKVRREEHRRLLAQGDTGLMNTKYLGSQARVPKASGR